MTTDWDNPRPDGAPVAPWPPAPSIKPSSLDGAGKLPWRVIETMAPGLFPIAFQVKDFYGTNLFAAAPGIARQVVSAVNCHLQMLGNYVVAIDALKALRIQVSAMPRSAARTRALDLIEDALHPNRADAS